MYKILFIVSHLNSDLNNIGNHQDDDSSCQQIVPNIYARRYGDCVYLNITGATFTASGNNLVFDSLPSKYRPIRDTSIAVYGNSHLVLGNINSNGRITIYSGGTTNKDVYVSTTYFIK